HLANRLRPADGVAVAQERHRTDLAGTVTVLTALLQDRRDMLREGDAAGTRQLRHPPNSAAGHGSRRNGNSFACQRFLDGKREIAPRRLAGALVADAELIVDTAAIEHLPRWIEDEHFRSA